ncbi:MAG: flgC [Rickettsiaceae bacterium]|jgi:flagellar basal-body rod protein FlgC|nr:flgC [Rickettsiaceae bacterium]
MARLRAYNIFLLALNQVIILSYLIFTPNTAFSLEDSLLKSMEIAGHGAKVQMERLKIAAENIANEDSTGTLPGEAPYQRKVLFVENKYDPKLKTNIVKVKKYSVDKSVFIKRFDPHHPAADAEGYVLYPNVYKEIEKADTIEAKNSYEANLSVIEISKAMLQKTIEVMR